jgi:hypothetical protein
MWVIRHRNFRVLLHFPGWDILRAAAVVMAAGWTGAGATELSPAAATLIAPVHAAFERVRMEQSKAGSPKDIRDRLVRLGQLDQAGRDVLQTIDLSGLSPEQRAAASAAAWAEIDAQDAADRAALDALLPRSGWFTISLYGAAASAAAWSVVQHQTDDSQFMAAMLDRMAPAARKHDVNPHDYALLVDRVAMLQGKDQVYGSQFVCVDHHWTLYKLADPANVELRRKSLGLTETESQVKARIATYAPCFFSPAKNVGRPATPR